MGLYRPDTKDRGFNKGGQAHHYGCIFFREKPYVFGVHHRVYRDFDNDGQLGATHIAYYILGCINSGIKAYGRKMVARKIRGRICMLLQTGK